MGLDMYLHKRIYVGADYDHRKVTGNIEVFSDGKPIKVNFKRVSEITEKVGYWRKANAIHKWFVDNIQEGKDDCGDYYVSEDDLQKLLSVCKTVWENKTLAAELLPPKSGFFFGGTEIDEYYFQDIKDTIEIIESILSEKEGEYINGDIYYHSSW